MRFSDGFFPQRIRPYVERAVSRTPARSAGRPSTPYDTLQRDPKMQRVEVTATGTLYRTAESIGGLMRLLQNGPPDYENTIALPGVYGRHVNVEGSGAYDHHPHPDRSGVVLASTVLHVAPKDYAARSRLSYYILAMTPRSSGADSDLRPSQDEHNNSVPVFLIPELPGESAAVFTLSQTPCYYEPLAPAEAKAVQDIEVPRWVEAASLWANPS